MSIYDGIRVTVVCSFLVMSGRAFAVDAVDYATQIKPVLADRCYACHGALKQEGGLRLDAAVFAIKGGVSGPAVVPGAAEESLLLQRIAAVDEPERMPAEGQPLNAAEIALLRAWIDSGAAAPGDEQPEQDPREHWAFKPIVRPAIPAVANSTWVRNPIDAFVAHQHERRGLQPQREAPPEALARRLYIDLIGLPPDEASLQRAINEPSDHWYDELVDRLLNDPCHGERWARHWMDIWRYSDWWGLGEQLRNSQPHIWHWRDWIVESLNVNMPYDEMVRLMLAADELHPNDLDKLRATGFLARNWALFGRDLWMDETVEHVSKGLLGLTMNCAKCHDHKFDPVEQVDYYRMRAFFEPYHVRIDMLPGQADLARDGIPRVFDGVLDAPTFRYERGQETQPDKSKAIEPGVPAISAFAEVRIQPVSLPRDAWQPERRSWVLDAHLAAARKAVQEAQAATDAAEETGKAAAELAEAVAVAELCSIEARATAMRAAWRAESDGEDANPRDDEVSCTAAAAIRAERQAAVAHARKAVSEVEIRLRDAAADAKAAIEAELAAAREAQSEAERTATAAIAPTDKFTPLVGAKWTPTRFQNSLEDDPTVNFSPQSTGRRTALAAWIIHPQNPLAARVAVNHIWARHLGTPLVASMFDFGRKGSRPSNPELLDWLAAEFIDSGWDMRRLHRLIVTSAAYRLSSSAAGCHEQLVKDPDNLHLWRRTPIRVESQVVRDSILSLAGTLDLSRGGPPVMPADQIESTRRSLYFFHSNNERNAFLTAFDEAGVKECYRRDQSVVPQQALALSNSRLVHDAAQRIAERLAQPANAENSPLDDREFIRRAFLTLLAARASAQEIDACLRTLDVLRALPAESGEDSVVRSRTHLAWALLNHNDFVTLR